MTADTSEDQAAIPKKYKLMLAIQMADKHLSNPDTGANPSEVREFVESLLREAATEFPKDSGTLKLMTKQMKRKFEAHKAQMGPASSVESQTLSTAMMGQLEVVVVDGAGEPVADVDDGSGSEDMFDDMFGDADAYADGLAGSSAAVGTVGDSDNVDMFDDMFGDADAAAENVEQVSEVTLEEMQAEFEKQAVKTSELASDEAPVVKVQAIPISPELEQKKMLLRELELQNSKAVDTERLAQLDQKAGVVPEAEATPKPKAAAAAVAEVNAGDDSNENILRNPGFSGDAIELIDENIVTKSAELTLTEKREALAIKTDTLRERNLEIERMIAEKIERLREIARPTKRDMEELQSLIMKQIAIEAEYEKSVFEEAAIATGERRRELIEREEEDRIIEKQFKKMIAKFFSSKCFTENKHLFSSHFLESVVGMLVGVRNEHEFGNLSLSRHDKEVATEERKFELEFKKDQKKIHDELDRNGRQLLEASLKKLQRAARAIQVQSAEPEASG